MKLLKTLLITAALAVTATGYTSTLQATTPIEGLTMKNAKNPTENLVTGGQPGEADLQHLAIQGVKTVINLRTSGEFDGYDEAAVVNKLGLQYHVLEISGESGITKENALALDQLLTQSNGKTLVHCGSGNRVGALLALREFFVKGQSAEQALTFGKAAGLTRLADKVAKLIISTSK